jgi:hypothetical protein
MKNIVRLSVLTALSIIVISCATGKKTADTTTVSPLSGKTSVSPGSVVYALPRTVFNIIVEMERTTEIPGPYWRYAGELLGLSNVIEANDEYWTITGVSVESGEELDPSQFYVIESNTLIETNVLALRNEGLILDLNPGIYYSRGNNNQTETNETGRFIQKDLGAMNTSGYSATLRSGVLLSIPPLSGYPMLLRKGDPCRLSSLPNVPQDGLWR